MPWLWAAYRRDGFARLPSGLTQEQFRLAAVAELRKRTEAFVLTARGENGPNTAVGLVLDITDSYHTAPEVVWFPWASKRNRIECSVRWVHDMRKSRLVLFHVKPSERKLFEQFGRYGVTRFVGIIEGHYAPGQDALVYQSKAVADG